MNKLFRSIALAALAAFAVLATAAPSLGDGTLRQVADAMNFGSPPSGEIPILYNDHHVYANPDTLKQNRVLAALVKNGTILVPLRSMFEAMGATVKWDPASQTATAAKEGASVQVTVGKTEAVINGETRPLDVPPEIYKGVVVVPVRVISEALGAYVQWVPDRRITVVRYIPPTPVPTAPPTPIPTPVPTVAPTATPTPAPAKQMLNGYVEGAYVFHRVSNEFAAQATTTGSYQYNGVLLFNPFAVKAGLISDQYNTTVNGVAPVSSGTCNPSLSPNPVAPGTPVTFFTTIDSVNGNGYCWIPQTKFRQTVGEARVEYKVFNPGVYIGAGYLGDATNYGYPKLNGFGFGIEKLLTFDNNWDIHGSYFYYPNMAGNYTVNDPNSPNFGVTYRQVYRQQNYDIGLDFLFTKAFPVYLYAGWGGDVMVAKSFAPINQTHSGPYVGLGFKF